MKYTPIDLIKISKGFYRDSDKNNDYLIESKKIKETTTPEGLKEHELLIRVVVQPKTKNDEKD